jgi:nucleoside-diphosphate-sugar epimerase
VVALGSMSVVSKRDSADAGERRQARSLADAEADLFAAASRLGTAVTVLRPTLVYGHGGEMSLAPLVRFARRWHFCPFPRGASGLRQPVHVDDIASAVLACLDNTSTAGRAYDLPGGETLPLDAMVRRTLAARAPGSRLVPLPASLMRLALWFAGRGRAGPVSAAGFLARRGQDQCADIGPAQRDFGYYPGPFRP